jgi:hypothetical protein
MSKTITRVLVSMLAAVAVLGLAACTIPIGPAKVLQLYDGAPRDKSQVAQIRLHSTKANPSNVIEKLWGAGVMSIDGKDTEGYSVAHVLPGKHTFKMYCWNRNSAVKKNEITTEVVVAAGKTYYPWSSTTATVLKGSGAAGAIAGTRVGEVAAGYCTPYFENVDPDMAR